MATNVKRLDVLNPVEGRDGKTYWTRVGTLFENPGGTLSGALEQLPLNGRLVIRAADAPRSKGEADEA